MSSTGRFKNIINEIKRNPNKQFSVTDITKNMGAPDSAEFKRIARKLKDSGAHIIW